MAEALADPSLDATAISWRRDGERWTLTLEHQGQRATLHGIPATTQDGRVEQLFVALGLAGHATAGPSALQKRLHAPPAPPPAPAPRPPAAPPIPPPPDPSDARLPPQSQSPESSVVPIVVEDPPLPTPAPVRRPWRVGAMSQFDTDGAVGVAVHATVPPGIGVRASTSHNRDAQAISNVVPSTTRLRVQAWDVTVLGEASLHPRFQLGAAASVSARFFAARRGAAWGAPRSPARRVGFGWIPAAAIHAATEIGRAPLVRLELAWVHDLRRVTLDLDGRTTSLPTDRLRASFGIALGGPR